eukprot:6759642-Pyramimonas_sp.AAC.1
MNSFIRVRARVRVEVSKEWTRRHPNVDIWGLGAGSTSTDPASQLNLETEIAEAANLHALTAMMGAC